MGKIFGEVESLQYDIGTSGKDLARNVVCYVTDFFLRNLLLVLVFGYSILSKVWKESSWVFVLGL